MGERTLAERVERGQGTVRTFFKALTDRHFGDPVTGVILSALWDGRP
jgi:hypothetical protein